MAGKASIIYNSLDTFDHLDRKNILYIRFLLLSTLRQSRQSHIITLSETNKDNTCHGLIARKPVKYPGKFFLNFNRPIATFTNEQDNGKDFAIIKVDNICLKGIIKSEHMYMFFELIRTSDKNNHNFLVFVNHLYTSYNYIFFTWGYIPHVSIRLAAPLKPKSDAKPRHSQSMLIPGKASTSGCARGGAFVLAAKEREGTYSAVKRRRKEKKKTEDKKVSIIDSFEGLIYLPSIFFVFHIFTIYLPIKTRNHYPHGALPRSREQLIYGIHRYPIELSTLVKGEWLLLFPALRPHLWSGQCLRLTDSSYFSFLSKIPEVLSDGPDETYSSGPPQHHALLIRTSIQINKMKEVFLDRLTRILTPYKNRAVSVPGFISLKKYAGLLLRGFLFLAAKTREDTRRIEKEQTVRRQTVRQSVALQSMTPNQSCKNRWVSKVGSKKRIHLFLESSPLPLTCEQGAKSVDRWQLALRFALLYLPLRRTKSND